MMGTQLSQMARQIEWRMISAIAAFDTAWTPVEPIAVSQRIHKVVIYEDPALNCEGNNAELLFRMLGCEVERFNVTRDQFPEDVSFLYFPNGHGDLALKRLKQNQGFVEMLKSSVIRGDLSVIAHGGAAPMFAQRVVVPYGPDMEGIGILPLEARFTRPNAASLNMWAPVECIAVSNGIFLHSGEKLRGYNLPQISMRGNNTLAVWSVTSAAGVFNTGWEVAGSIFTEIQIDLLSNIEALRRLLVRRKSPR
jgi:cobyrinic acid a,c-diamide synthase